MESQASLPAVESRERQAREPDARQPDARGLDASPAPSVATALGTQLGALVRLVEQQSPGLLCSILLLDGTHLRHGAAPSLPDDYNRVIDGLAIGPAAGSCGTAAYRGERVIVRDTLADPLWADYRELAGTHGLRACWSTPIRGATGQLLGTFALYYREPRSPTPEDLQLIESAARLAAAVIDRHRAEAERGRLIDALELERSRLRAIFAQAPAAIAVLRGPELVYEMANQRYQRFVGHRDIIGKPIRDALPELGGQGLVERLEEIYRTGQPWIADGVRMLLDQTGEGVPEERYFDIACQPIRETNGAVSGIFAQAVEVTDQVRAREALQASNRELQRVNAEQRRTEQRLRLAQEAGRIVVFEWSIPERRVIWTGELERVYGVPADTFEETLEGWQRRIAPEDVQRIMAEISACLERRDTEYASEFRVVLPDGSYRWLAGKGRFLYDAGGRPLRMFGVNMDITDRKQADAERERLLASAEAARAEAEEANRAKSGFLAAMSHELRTPLNAIAGYVQLIDMGLHGPVSEAQHEALERVQRSQQHLLSLINDVLNFAKLEAGRVEYALEDVGLSEAVAGVVPMIEPQLAAKGMTCEVDVDPALIVTADREKLEQILLNLLSNAVKFTDANGRVAVRAGTAAGSPDGPVQLIVADTGIGIPADRLEAIFDPFVQVHRDLRRHTEGTGLGLAISRDLARGMGGDLTVRSVVGGGATFTVTLRRAERAGRPR